MATQGIEHCRTPQNGPDLGYVSVGTGPLVIFLHGFPDTWRGFQPILERTAAAGYRAVALASRGFAPSSVAADGDYRVEASARDVLALADALGADRFSVVGHDWGAVTAYATANLAPGRVARLVTAGVPHTGHFLLGMGIRQIIRSLYMVWFQVPWHPEHTIPRNDFAWIEATLRSWSPDWRFGESELRPLKDNFQDPERLKAALAYYRQLFRDLLSPLSRRLIFAPVAAPTRMLYGMRDGCIGPEMFQRQERRFPGGLDLVALPDAGHFMQWEQPDAFARQVIGFLDRP